MMTSSGMFWLIAAVLVFVIGLSFVVGWRWASRNWQLAYPSLFSWILESRIYHRISGTSTTLDRLGLTPGQRILEIGPGPGRLLIPAAQRVQPGGEAVGVDIQPGMIQRLNERAERAGVRNLTAVLGDATQLPVEDASFDLAFLATTLGEIPDRAAAIAHCFRALRPGAILSITEIFGDPHYQSLSVVQQLAEKAGFVLQSVQGRWWFFTANFQKPPAADEAPLQSTQDAPTSTDDNDR